MKRHKPGSGIIIILLLSVVMNFVPQLTRAQIDIEQEEKVRESTANLTFLVFSGSDWCLPCIRFEREVLQATKFKTFSNEYLVIEKVDFPQHKKLSEEQVRHEYYLLVKVHASY